MQLGLKVDSLNLPESNQYKMDFVVNLFGKIEKVMKTDLLQFLICCFFRNVVFIACNNIYD